ncbi:MAG: hypothetical protein H6R45_935 [Proteobacteria bacterium]|nr:hypothetical protein [Pseudomonadota bacterium]
MKRLAVLALALTASLPAPAAAQDEVSDNVNVVIVYGDDECPASPDARVIVVCPRMEEQERYRIPSELRESDDPANEAWASRVKSMETVGSFGTLSCSASGFGGWAGCTQALIDAAYEEKRTGSSVRAAQLIQEERDKRLSTIDADAAAEQARVEVLEKAYEEKLAKEREAALPGETPSDTGGE